MAEPDEDYIPDWLRIPQAERNAEWVKHPPRATPVLRKMPDLPPPPEPTTKED